MRKLAIAMALSSTVLAAPALARDGAGYAGIEFGPMIVEDVDVDIGALDNAVTIDSETGFDGSIFAGYDLGAVRLEVEAGYKKAAAKSISTAAGVVVPGGFPGAQVYDPAFGGMRVFSVMGNALLDFGDDEGVSGFIGGGAGWAKTEVEVGARPNFPGVIDDKDSGFAWQILAGVRQAITPNVDAHLKYRFFNANLDLISVAGLESDARFRSHSLMGGLTFNFGQAAPPPISTASHMVRADQELPVQRTGNPVSSTQIDIPGRGAKNCQPPLVHPARACE